MHVPYVSRQPFLRDVIAEIQLRKGSVSWDRLTFGIANAKDFGAKGDGETDDFRALQAALDSASELGGVVYLPPGIYMVSETILVPERVLLLGASRDMVTVKLTGGHSTETACTVVEMEDYAEVVSLTVDGNYPENLDDEDEWQDNMSNPDKGGDGPPMAHGLSASKYFWNDRDEKPSWCCRVRDVAIGNAIRSCLYAPSRYLVAENLLIYNSYTDHHIYTSGWLNRYHNITCTGYCRDSATVFGANANDILYYSTVSNLTVYLPQTTPWPNNTGSCWSSINLHSNAGYHNMLDNIIVYENMTTNTESATVHLAQPYTMASNLNLNISGSNSTNYGAIFCEEYDGECYLSNVYAYVHAEKSTSSCYVAVFYADVRASNCYFGAAGSLRWGIKLSGEERELNCDFVNVCVDTPGYAIHAIGTVNPVSYGFTGSMIQNNNYYHQGTVNQKWLQR